MSTGQTPSYHTSEDEQILHKLGYAQELFRAMGGFRNFAIRFTIISILAGCLTSYTIAFEHGGPVAVTWGWLLVGLMSTLIALAMAEIASAYPTAGGLYYWASKLGSPGWGWATGWFNLIGQIAVTAAIGYGLAVFAQVLFDYWFNYTAHMNDWFGASFNMSTYILYAAFMLAAVLINMFNIRLTSGLNMISAWWHMVGVVLVVGILIIVPDQHQSLSYVFTETVNNSGYGGGTTSFSNPAFWFVFGLGLLMSQYTITGFDASAHTAEETNKASRMAATGMWTSVFVSVVFGWILLLAVTFAIPDTQSDDRHGQRAPADRAVHLGAVDEPALGGVPALHLRRRAVLLRHRVDDVRVADDLRVLARPRRAGPSALAASREEPRAQVVGARSSRSGAAILMVPAIWNYFIGYAVGTAIAVIGLYIAFIIPVYLRWRKGDSWDEPRAWSLGRHYKWLDVVSILWVVPDHDPVHLPALHGRPAVERPVRLAVHELHGPVVRGHRPRLRRLVGAVRQELVQGPVRMGTEEELERLEAGAGSASSRFRPKRRRRDPRLVDEGRRKAPLVASARERRDGRPATPPSGASRSKCSLA